jgi:hypothetical protein
MPAIIKGLIPYPGFQNQGHKKAFAGTLIDNILTGVIVFFIGLLTQSFEDV